MAPTSWRPSMVKSFSSHIMAPITTTSSSAAAAATVALQAKSFNNEDYDDDEEASVIDLSDKDWRAFRAKLVMGETSAKSPSSASNNKSSHSEAEDTVTMDVTSSGDDWDGIGSVFASDLVERLEDMTPLDPSQWAYESGNVIEQGAVILGGVEQDFGFSLRQQYFHKAAILVLEHDQATFTKGIILNRPTDLLLNDDLNPGVTWRVWYGGDVQGMSSGTPEIICLHSIQDPQVMQGSRPVMNEIQWTSFDNAKKMVNQGNAKPTDFWVFCGYAG